MRLVMINIAPGGVSNRSIHRSKRLPDSESGREPESFQPLGLVGTSTGEACDEPLPKFGKQDSPVDIRWVKRAKLVP